MSVNMSYCRCQNTLAALSEVYDDFTGKLNYVEELSEDEAKAFHRIVELCQNILDDVKGE